MEWDDRLATGHRLLDEQHRELLRCLNELEMATRERRTLLAVYCITRLKHNVRNHFADEEAIMKECGYPDLQAHIKEHQEFSAKLLDLQIKSIHHDVTLEMVEFLSDWLTRHVVDSDREYIPYLKS